jgi:hypothetical protein
VLGEFTILHARLSKINSSRHGPFDGLICAGEWFAADGSETSAAPAFPIPVHVLGDDKGPVGGADEGKDAGSASGVHFLGRCVFMDRGWWLRVRLCV